jgi:hypothetical protein
VRWAAIFQSSLPRRPIHAAVIALAMAAVPFVGSRVADAIAGEAARGAAALGEAIAPGGVEGEAATLEEILELGQGPRIDVPRGVVERVAVAAPRVVSGRARGASSPPPVLGILVREDVVRAAVARGGRPSGTPIAASGARPAGLVLHGVTGYGTALRDGDVLVRVGGTPATSEGRVIAAVSGAVRSRARAIDGEVWRAGRSIPVVVEIPSFRRTRARKSRSAEATVGAR